ncbi:hypothetical protein ACO0QE_004473 [Hanseniaspora vineae]
MQANDPMFQVSVDESEDTEWNDILRQHGIIPQKKEDPNDELEDVLNEVLAEKHANRLEHKTLDELDQLEDDEDEDFLESYKQKRMGEILKLQEASKFGQVFHINKPEYAKEITEASEKGEKGVYVLVHMSLSTNLQSRILSNLFVEAARKFKDLKFVEIPANRCIENYPEKNCPTLIIYHKGEVVKNLVTLLMLGGNDTKLLDLEKLLVQVGCVDEHDSRLLSNQSADGLDEEIKHLNIIDKRSGIRSGIQGKFNLGTGANDSSDEEDFFD